MATTAHFYHAGSEIDGDTPLEFGPLNADADQVSTARAVVVKLEASKVSSGAVVIDGSGTSDAKFQLSLTSDFVGAPAYGAPLTITDPIDDTTGVTFYVRAKAVSGEVAQVDASVAFAVTSGLAVAA